MATLVGLPSRREYQKSRCGQCRPLASALSGTYVAVGFILSMSFVLYILLLMSPEVLNHLLHNVIKCEDVPGSSAADNVDYMEYICHSSTPSPILRLSDDNTTTCKDTLETADGCSVDTQPPLDQKKIRVLIGIFVMPWNIKQRHLLRLAYGVQSSKDMEFTIRFVMGELVDGNAYYRSEVERDNATFGDIIVLNCTENADDGKTFTFFSSLPGMVDSGAFDYVMKAADDSYVRIANLGKHLKPLPRSDLYYGYTLPCGNADPYTGWMAGAGYLLSWDLVQWIGESPIPRSRIVGLEDKLTRDWFDEGGVAKNRATSVGLFYDRIEHARDLNCAHEQRLDSIMIHKLKTGEQWHEVLAFFLTDRSNSLH